MLNPVSGRTTRLNIGQLVKVITEPVDGTTIKPRPERRFAHRHATHACQRGVVVGRARDHVDVRIDVVHLRVVSVARDF